MCCGKLTTYEHGATEADVPNDDIVEARVERQLNTLKEQRLMKNLFIKGSFEANERAPTQTDKSRTRSAIRFLISQE